MAASRDPARRALLCNCGCLVCSTWHNRHSRHLTGHKRLTVRFRAKAPVHCLWADWGGDCVVYHRPSGKTHLLNTPSAVLLTRVLAVPLDVESAAAELAGAQSARAGPDFVDYVAGLLFRFEELGLVERVDP